MSSLMNSGLRPTGYHYWFVEEHEVTQMESFLLTSGRNFRYTKTRRRMQSVQQAATVELHWQARRRVPDRR